VRRGELRKAEYSEFDLDSATWNIPANEIAKDSPQCHGQPAAFVRFAADRPCKLCAMLIAQTAMS
jgi:hypothetical protein